MAEKKKEKQSFTTPKGTLLFASIKEIDYGTEDYPCKEGRFKVTLSLPKKEAKVLLGKLEAEIDQAKDAAQDAFEDLKPQTRKKLGEMRFNDVAQEEYDADENPTGNYRFVFRTSAFYKTKDGTEKKKTVPVFDSLNQPVKLPDEIGNGSIGRIAFTVSPYFVEGTGVGGLSLYLNAIQLVDYQRPGERSAEAYGFEVDEEDGFVASQVDEEDEAEEDNDTEEASKRPAKGKGKKAVKASEDEDEEDEDNGGDF